jgi:hypothetical protein
MWEVLRRHLQTEKLLSHDQSLNANLLEFEVHIQRFGHLSWPDAIQTHIKFEKYWGKSLLALPPEWGVVKRGMFDIDLIQDHELKELGRKFNESLQRFQSSENINHGAKRRACQIWNAIRQIFNETGDSRIFSKTLIKNLCAKSDRPWPEANRGKQISETWLARRLHDFGINSNALRIGNERFKGYEISDFADAFERYLPAPGLSSRDSVTNRMDIDDFQFSRRDAENLVTVSNPLEAIENIDLSRRHASIPPLTEELAEVILI